MIAIAAATFLVSGAGAADLPGHGQARSACLVAAEHSTLATMPASALLPEIQLRFNRAVATANEPRAIDNNRPTFLWALEARQACAAAIGYLRGGAVERDYVAKCDCFHDRMIGHFR